MLVPFLSLRSFRFVFFIFRNVLYTNVLYFLSLFHILSRLPNFLLYNLFKFYGRRVHGFKNSRFCYTLSYDSQNRVEYTNFNTVRFFSVSKSFLPFPRIDLFNRLKLELTSPSPRNTVLIHARSQEIIQLFVELECLLPCSQKLVTCPYSESD
jgi:hypothetical protein